MKKYTILSLILITLAGLFTYINTNETTTFEFFGINITLLNAVWNMLFLIIFYLISMLYFFINSFKTYRFEKTINKDEENLLKNIKSAVLYKNKFLPIKNLSKIDKFIQMIKGDKIEFKEDEDFDFLSDLIKIKNGEIVDLKNYKFEITNPWYLKNLENKLKTEDIKVLKEALKTPLKDKALKILSKKASVNEILANDYPITKETLLNNLENVKLKELIEKSNLSNQEYIEVASELYKKSENPSEILELFKSKLIAYIYILIEYEMLEEAKELATANEIKIFEYYLMLREDGHKIPIKDFLNAKI